MIAAFDPIHDLELPEEQWRRVGSQHFIIADLTAKSHLALFQNTTFLTDLLSFIVYIFVRDEIPRNFASISKFDSVRIDYWNSFVPTMVRATHAQSHKFFGFAKGKQCAAMVFVVLAYAQLADVEWTQEILDELLIAGNRLYLYIREDSETPHKRHLRADEFSVIEYGQSIFKAENVNIVDLIGPFITAGEFMDRTKLLLAMNCSVSFLFGYSFYGIFKQTKIMYGEEIEKFCLFDSHGTFTERIPARDGQRMPHEKKAIILLFDNLSDLVYHVFRTLLAFPNNVTPDELNKTRLQYSFNLYAYNIDVHPNTIDSEFEPIDLNKDRPLRLELTWAQKLNFMKGKMKDLLKSLKEDFRNF